MKKLRFTDGRREELTAGKIICVGRNYRAHAREMNSPPPERPVIFLKPESSLIGDGDDIILPGMSEEVHHEIEIAAVIGKGGKYIGKEEAEEHVAGYALFLDMTARDLQRKAKEKGLPWTVSKGFDTFSVISDIIPADAIANPQAITFRLEVNGTLRQRGETGDMIFSVAELISYISGIMTLEEGDIIATGTPEGVSEVVEGDTLTSSMDGLVTMTNRVRKEQRF